MKQGLQEKLFAIEPKWFKRKDTKNSLMNYGFTCGDGWYHLLETLLKLAKSEQLTDKSFGKFEVTQVKEKFGRLTVYYSGGNECFRGAVALTGMLSARICEQCGAPGDLREVNHWWRSLCHQHLAEKSGKNVAIEGRTT